MPTLEQARAWYSDEDPTHDFNHIQRVMAMAKRIAQAEGADIEIVVAASLLHDAQGANPALAEARATHHEGSAAFARKILTGEGWEEGRIRAVQECIRTHRFRTGDAPQTLEAKVLFDADKLDAIGAIGVARALAYAATSGHPFFLEPSARFSETGQVSEGELHSAYHEYAFKLSKLVERLYTETARNVASRRHAMMVAYFEQLRDEMLGIA